MTTIAYSYKDKQIAVDSRITANNKICTDSFNKIYMMHDVTFVMCGETAHFPLLIDAWLGEYDGEELNAKCLAIIGTDVYEVDYREEGLYKNLLTYDEALGSGSDYALAAMDLGESPAAAVRYASTRDCATGGRVQTIDIE